MARGGTDRTLVVTLAVGVVMVLLSAYLYPHFRRADIPPVAEWHMINVNGSGLPGDANLLLVGDKVVMIDGGLRVGAERAVVPYLQDLGISRVDHFFVSNPSPAFYEGLVSLIENGVDIGNLYYLPADMTGAAPGSYNPDELGRFGAHLDYARTRGARLRVLAPGFELGLPNKTRLVVAAIGRDDPGTMTNSPGDASVVLRFELPRSSVLFSGNPGIELATTLGTRRDLGSVFLKAPHPDTEGLPETFFDAVDPKLVLVPGAKRWWCGDSGRTARDWTIGHETPTWVTGTNGHIRVIWQTRQVMVLPQTQNEACKLREFGNYIR